MKSKLLAALAAFIAVIPSGLNASDDSGANLRAWEPASEILPVKYARASEIADILNSLGNDHGSPTNLTPRLYPRAPIPPDLKIVGRIKTISDERSNSILIFATTPSDIKTIKEIVSKLDVVLPQILIEATVFEVSLPRSRSNGERHAESQASAVSDLFPGSAVITNLHVLWVTNIVSVTGTNDTNWEQDAKGYLIGLTDGPDSVVAALIKDPRINVIQKPRILTSDGVGATIFVGRTVPFSTGGSPGAYQQLQSGFSIGVTPMIQPDARIALDLQQIMDWVEGATHIEGVGDVPNTNSKQLRATVTVRDGEVFIMGGMIRPTDQPGSSGVPVLKSIPLPGKLFRGSSVHAMRKELVVLFRPIILKVPPAHIQPGQPGIKGPSDTEH